jgi:hypothetical protein
MIPLSIEPAGEGIAGEPDHAAALALDYLNEDIVDCIDAPGQLFDPAPGAELAGEFFGERRKPGNVGEQGCTLNVIRQGLTAG